VYYVDAVSPAKRARNNNIVYEYVIDEHIDGNDVEWEEEEVVESDNTHRVVVDG
jgi:hypothetical protein